MVLERSAFAGARVMVDRVKPLAVCGVCGESFSPVSLYASCPKCGSYKTRLVSGQEFRLTSLLSKTIFNENKKASLSTPDKSPIVISMNRTEP